MTSRVMKSTQPVVHLEECSVNDWIGCVYENKWYLARIDVVDLNLQEVKVTFWKPASTRGTAKSFISENQSCFVPIGNILKVLAPPNTSRSSRSVQLPVEVQMELDELLKNYIN